MALSHVSKLFAVVDAKMAKMTADPSGGSATYATSIDLPGIKSLEVGGQVNVKELRGDNQQLDVQVTLSNVTATVAHAKISLDALAVMIGSTVTDSGTTPNQIATMTLLGGSTFSYFKLEGKTPTGGSDSPTGDAHWVLYKCILNSFPSLGLAEEDYRTASFGVNCVPRIADSKILDGVLNETAVTIP